MRIGKPTSKRTPVRLRHKIEKASNAKQRKQRKEAKKSPQWRSRLKKDPGIPNLFPYKAKVLAELEEKKREKEEEQARKKEVAKARREGRAVEAVTTTVGAVKEGEEIMVDDMEDDSDLDAEDSQAMEVEVDGGSANPMAALVASAQARADAYAQSDESSEDDEDDEAEEWGGISEPSASTSKKSVAPTQPSAKKLPQQAIQDPIKAVNKLLDRMKEINNGMQQLMDQYQLPPLVTAGSDLSTRFLVEVARKRGRLGKGGVPNLHSAALTVLGDLNEGRIVLPAAQKVKVESKAKGNGAGGERGEVTVVQKLAEPFRIEGLFGGDDGGDVVEEEMVVET